MSRIRDNLVTSGEQGTWSTKADPSRWTSGLRTPPGLGTNNGWHTFRHTYRNWLDAGGANVSVQRELMRHASIQTTMNVYGAGNDVGREAPGQQQGSTGST